MPGVAPRVVHASFSTVSWAPDGRTVVKTFPDRAHVRRFDAERRVNALLTRRGAPVVCPRLVDADRRRLELRFEAVEGEPLGPKYPLATPETDVDAMIELAFAVPRFGAGTGRLRRMPTAWVLAPFEREMARAWLRDDPPRWVFSHGDITARNVLRREADGAAVLIDWEWAGLYPEGWELAFVWYALIDVPGARERVAAAVPARQEAWFWRSALLITLLHLRLGSMPAVFRVNHEATRDELFRRVMPAATAPDPLGRGGTAP